MWNPMHLPSGPPEKRVFALGIEDSRVDSISRQEDECHGR